MEVMFAIQRAHPRSAPRTDDPDVTRSIADMWAELFSTYRLELPDLIAAVKKRALTEPLSPEPAEIIKYARDIRRDRDARQGPSAEYETLCESKGKPTEAELAYNREKLAAITSGIGKTINDA